MKTIQLIQKPQLRGAEIFAQQLSKELCHQGHESILVTIFDNMNGNVLPGNVISLGGSPSRRLWDLNAWQKLARIVATEKPDLIQANSGDTLKYAVSSKLIFRWKTPIVFRNASTISLYIKSKIARQWNSFLFQHTEHIISVSEFSKKDFVTTFPAMEKKITVVPIGVDIPERLTQRDNCSDTFNFLHIGGFSFEKNHKGLISIFEKLKVKFPKATLALVGDGVLRPEIERLVKLKKLDHAVKFYGYQPNPEQFFEDANCFLLPSIIEGMPSVILEAFLYEVPVVAYDVGGIREIVRTDQTGWLIKKNDEDDFVGAVSEAMENKEKVSANVSAAFRLVTEKFDLKIISQEFIRVYETVLKGSWRSV